MQVAAMDDTTHNPFNETHWVSCLRENLTSSSYGEGLETGRATTQAPRQSFTRQTCFEDGKQSLGMGDYEVRSWRGWHHHMTLCILDHFFLVRLQCRWKKKPRA